MNYEELGEFIVVRATDLAVAIDMGDEELTWLPRSVVEDGEDMEEGKAYVMNVKTWFVEKEGLF